MIEDYGPKKEPQVYYARRGLCVGCHRAGAPIFPRFSWLETEDNLLLDTALILKNFRGGRDSLKEKKVEVEEAINKRLNTRIHARALRGVIRDKLPLPIRLLAKYHQFRRNRLRAISEERAFTVKSGSFDFTVQRSSRILRLGQSIHGICGVLECRVLSVEKIY